ncbi:MAG: hypothetical protein RLZZ511_779 [Cyanobacteriota bacterium]|jgi:hypothetical protein
MTLPIKDQALCGLILLTGLGLGGCLPMSAEKQCRAMYLTSKAYEAYDQDAKAISIAAIEKHVGKIQPFDNTNPQQANLQVAQVMMTMEKVREKKAEIAEETAIGNETFAKQMKAQARKTKSIWATNSKVKDWQKVLVSFYETRDKYHRKMAILHRKSVTQTNPKGDSAEDKAFLTDLQKLSDFVNSKQSNQIRDELYEDFKRGCKIGPGVRIQSISK